MSNNAASQSCQPKDDLVRHYVEMRARQPLKGIDDTIHAIHAGTEFAAELRLLDIVALLNSHASLKARIQELEGALREVIRVGQWSGTDGLTYTSTEARVARAALSAPAAGNGEVGK